MTPSSLHTTPAAASAAPSGPARPAPSIFTQYLPPDLVVEPDWPDSRRRTIALWLAAAAIVLLAGCAHCVFAGGHGVLWMGLSRLSRVAAEYGMPGTHWLAAFEHLAGAFGLAWLALCLTVGASERVAPKTSQRITFHRRQVLLAFAPLFLGGGGLLALGLALALTGHPILAGLLEIPGWALFGAAAYRVLLPEARIAVTCLSDLNRGWSNQLLVTGGPYNHGSLVIRHDSFISASVIAIGWQRVLRCADLHLVWHGPDDQRREVIIRGAGTPAQLHGLAHHLNGPFTLSLDRPTLRGVRGPMLRNDQI